MGVQEQLTNGNDFAVRPLGIQDAIYVTEYNPGRITVAAGNTTRLLYTFNVDFQEIDNMTHGRVYFDRSHRKIFQWVGNAMQMIYGVERQLRSASVKVGRWKNF
ncbi:hypothetical protein AR689_07425 [Arthrobacter sp. EpRS71]|nr:hypothetical protein AR689_07425 [Arthrobacter sp. EpRS71]